MRGQHVAQEATTSGNIVDTTLKAHVLRKMLGMQDEDELYGSHTLTVDTTINARHAVRYLRSRNALWMTASGKRSQQSVFLTPGWVCCARLSEHSADLILLDGHAH